MKLNNYEIYKSIRKLWTRNPKTEVKENKRESRQQKKIKLKKETDYDYR